MYEIKRRSSFKHLPLAHAVLGAAGGWGEDVWAWHAAPPTCVVGGTGGGCRLWLRLCGCYYVKAQPRKKSCKEPSAQADPL